MQLDPDVNKVDSNYKFPEQKKEMLEKYFLEVLL